MNVQRELVEKVRHFGSRRAYLRAMQAARTAPPAAPAPVTPREPLRRTAVRTRGAFACVAIGTSTGGPVPLSQILPRLPASFPVPIVAVQHMPPGFTRPLAERLDAASKIAVIEGKHGLTSPRALRWSRRPGGHCDWNGMSRRCGSPSTTRTSSRCTSRAST
ncbi:hypothetical protein WPS_12970 [Vulcanimicrobium alpinum]|uniref:protein-glutamate methylesterase n=1 Tax=Vulcanimicrobium alpinum TaxID=3016050 RepID=A0AAN1XWT9_UNVUL|nr:hypothetical protein WPS_12970 [Vulcanimicrobium alpinum]